MEPTIEDYKVFSVKVSMQRNTALDQLAQAETTIERLAKQLADLEKATNEANRNK